MRILWIDARSTYLNTIVGQYIMIGTYEPNCYTPHVVRIVMRTTS